MDVEVISKNRNALAISNKIIEAKYTLSKEEQKLIFLVVSQIDKGDDDFKEYKIYIKDLEDKELSKKNHTYVKEVSQRMMSRTLTVYQNKNVKDFKMYNWFSTIEYISSEGCLLVKLHHDLKPYFLELKNEFTRANLKHLIRFKSKYTSRLYLLLKKDFDYMTHRSSNKYEMETVYKVNDLVDRFELPNSYVSKYTNFKNKFLLVAINEINNINKSTGFTVSYDERKTGRKITSIAFKVTIDKNKQDIDKIISTKTKSDFIPHEKLSNKCIEVLLSDDLKLEIHDFKNIFKNYDIKDIEDVCHEMWKSWSNPKINNLTSIFRSKLSKKKEYNFFDTLDNKS